MNRNSRCQLCNRMGHENQTCYLRCKRGCEDIHSERECPFHPEKRCKHCEKKDHKSVDCPTIHVCKNCRKKGHFEKDCKVLPKENVDTFKKSSYKERSDPTNEKERNDVQTCEVCGKDGHTKAKCPREIICNLCEKKGHKANQCWKRCWAGCDELHLAKNCPVVCQICEYNGHHGEDCEFRCRRQCEELHSQEVCKELHAPVCYLCGVKGHPQTRCPNRCQACKEIHTKLACHVECDMCGEKGHRSRYCTNPNILVR